MIRNLYSVFDKKAESYSVPMLLLNDAVAMRSLRESVSNDSILMSHLNDYSLYRLGTFNDDSGMYDTYPPVHVIEIQQLMSGE